MIRVLTPGFQSTIQDLGRPGYAHLGVSASGAADPFSLRIGNLLVGNPEGAPAIEMTLVGGEFEFETKALISLTGSDFEPRLKDRNIALWSAIEIEPGQVLRLGQTKSGARCYLCVRGGFDVQDVLGSASTHLLTRLGGLSGRALASDDFIAIRSTSSSSGLLRKIDASIFGSFLQRTEIRVTSGAQEDFFQTAVLSKFYSSVFTVSEDSNRMGLRLSGATIVGRSHETVTEGTPLGSVQVPGSGGPIILFVEHQTTGGYPKIASVISADIHRVGQLRPRDSFRFKRVEIKEAISLLRGQEGLINSLKSSK